MYWQYVEQRPERVCVCVCVWGWHLGPALLPARWQGSPPAGCVCVCISLKDKSHVRATQLCVKCCSHCVCVICGGAWVKRSLIAQFCVRQNMWAVILQLCRSPLWLDFCCIRERVQKPRMGWFLFETDPCPAWCGSPRGINAVPATVSFSFPLGYYSSSGLGEGGEGGSVGEKTLGKLMSVMLDGLMEEQRTPSGKIHGATDSRPEQKVWMWCSTAGVTWWLLCAYVIALDFAPEVM